MTAWPSIRLGRWLDERGGRLQVIQGINLASLDWGNATMIEKEAPKLG